MKEKGEQELQEEALKKITDINLAQRVAGKMAEEIALNVTDFNKVMVMVALASIEKSYSSAESIRQIRTQPLPHGLISELKEELPDFLVAYTSLLRFRSFCKWGMISSFVFAVWGIYLLFMGYLPVELGGPLFVVFALLSFVFSTELLHPRKTLYEV